MQYPLRFCHRYGIIDSVFDDTSEKDSSLVSQPLVEQTSLQHRKDIFEHPFRTYPEEGGVQRKLRMIINLIPIFCSCQPEVQGLREGGHSPGSIQEGKRLLQAARRSIPCENRPRGKKRQSA